MKQKLIGVLYCILQAIVGILLLLEPVRFTSGILVAFGVLLALTGAVTAIKYFRTPVDEAAKDQVLTRGLLSMLVGLFCMFGRDWLIATFPIITVLYGVIMLVIGISKIQLVADTIRRKEKRWGLGIISALITLICAGIVIKNPFSSTAALWMFTGISIIVDAVFDFIALIFIRNAREELGAE